MNHAWLERKLRGRLLDRCRVVVMDVRGFGGTARYEGLENDSRLLVEWDPLQYDLLELVIHELCHPWLEKHLATIGELEEPAIEGIAKAHATHIRLAPARYRWWRDEIKKRVDRGSLKRWLSNSARVCE